MDNCIRKVAKIKHHNREIYGVSYLPTNKDKYPIFIFSHGFSEVGNMKVAEMTYEFVRANA